MNTKFVAEWKLSNEQAIDMAKMDLQTIIKNEINSFVHPTTQQTSNNSALVRALNSCFSKVEKDFNSERWVCFEDDIYFDKQAKGFWQFSQDKISISPSGMSEIKLLRKIYNTGQGNKNDWGVPTFNTLKRLTNLSKTPFRIVNGRYHINNCYLYKINHKVQGFNCDSGCFEKSNTGSYIPFLAQSKMASQGLRCLFINVIMNGFTPVKLKNDQLYKKIISTLNDKKTSTDLDRKSNSFKEEMLSHQIIQGLLNEDTIRADMVPYHAKTLEDTELGHWSLWTDELEANGQQTLTLPTPLVARDPKSSINEGVVGIDFGTKSTVVVYQKENDNIHPMRIGTGDLSSRIESFHYENPTIMEFKDLEAFIDAYDVKANKPYTRWQDLTISHTAQNAMMGSESAKFNTFLDEIKQWAGDKNRKLKIVGQKGKIIDLPPFLQLAEGDFNPIEIYAYYLGLYINNLNNGIFMDYILSFPVTYEMPIRDKIIESFRKGLMKSLPAELGSEALSQLNVMKGTSEPAAYALIALKENHFEPEGDERIFYGVFDFGGGTTDFDFGIYREATGKKERRYDYVIEHFGANGDKFLGGENLLELLAFEIFKKNKNALLAKSIQFEKHPEKDHFAGSEVLLSHSQEAKTNTKQLCIALRPFWEEYEDFSFDASGELTITLTDIHGVQHSAFSLDIDADELKVILASRIERGVENFFNALRLAFSNSQQSLHDINKVNIFLAGNSSQSSIVQALFDKYIAIENAAIGLAQGESHFVLFPPLGSDKNDVEKPTGKTGVAFGLVESRKGGSIKVIDNNVEDNDIRFKFYLGESRKKCFNSLIDRETPFGQWVDFIDASDDVFELYYTEQPAVSTSKISITDSSIKKKIIKLDVIDEEAMVYVRIISPTEVEYVIAYEDDIENNQYLNNINTITLA
ncbi:molecular chaperone DnaK [Aliivibrio sp. 1S165]|uniref:molecular chaperone DnaK n=1 Tax=unclassified Aliivibrio TaxID=2645654 RepID=UPI00080DCD9A|nr:MULTISPECIES: molecular chaperone DnaK [unclassified Aliivibrio]OCH16460.1 molecular chaperone DnaK [Aliivibrio sp. 1S165]OCH33897.1 molecular chaperone DnaK [Aliivibrio sp. 1S175]